MGSCMALVREWHCNSNPRLWSTNKYTQQSEGLFMTSTRKLLILSVTMLIGLLRTAAAHAEFNLFTSIFGGGCQECGEDKGCAVCVPVPTTVKHPKPVYRCKSVDFCVPKCSLHGIAGCGSCCVNCGPPRTKAVLMKKIVEEEHCGIKCEVQRGTPNCAN